MQLFIDLACLLLRLGLLVASSCDLMFPFIYKFHHHVSHFSLFFLRLLQWFSLVHTVIAYFCMENRNVSLKAIFNTT